MSEQESNERDSHAVQISLARIEGMLTASLPRFDQRLDQHEGTLSALDQRMREKGNTLARHDERIKDIEEDNSGRLGRITGTIGSIIGIAALALALWNRTTVGM